MSVELRAEKGGKVVDVTLAGTLSRADYERFMPELERLIEGQGRERSKFRMICQLRDFHGWTAGGMWEDIEFDARHFADIERLALIGDKRREAAMTAVCKPFTTAEVRYFDVADADEASGWIHEGVESATPTAG